MAGSTRTGESFQPPGFAEVEGVDVLQLDVVMAVVGTAGFAVSGRPVEFDALADQFALEVGEMARRVADRAGPQVALETEGGEGAGRLADVPLDGM